MHAGLCMGGQLIFLATRETNIDSGILETSEGSATGPLTPTLEGAGKPRACIYVNGVDAMPLPQLRTMDLAAAVLSFQERNMIRWIVICSSYLPCDAPDPPPNRELEDLVNFCKTKS
ncbi:hypothetical protein J437_LFUL007569 [Ladona fulva]|uniref:Uncharacterized protein n=1 Tax=Ladona fulva TaxID=123851 RepID=A0A8K0K609_LADFU|nr:hypothetical protein J437_LFUL007569 [Ladona fulva]